jgi:hypothetical protein
MDEKTLRQELVEAITKDPKAWSRILNLDTGAGTYEDVNELAAVIGEYIVNAVSSPEELAEYLREGHGLISIFAEVAQQNLNDAAGIGLRPMVTKPPNARIDAVVQELSAVESEKIKDALENVAVPELLSMVDAIIKYNADFQKRAGLQPIIKRTWSGSYPSHDTKHTDWCKDVAGEYEYDSRMDRRVFARHKGCRCKVEYFPNKNAEGRITALAKGEVDRDSVLWNTRSDTLEKRLKKVNKK